MVEKLRADPGLLERAKDNVRRWQATNGSPSPALTEWENILAGPLANVVALLTGHSERATRLRQSSPFAGILTEAERKAIYESYTTRTYHPGRQPNFG